MFVTKLLILGASAVIVLHSHCKGLKTGHKEPQNQVAEGDDAFHQDLGQVLWISHSCLHMV